LIPQKYPKKMGRKMKTTDEHEPRIMGGGDPLLLRIILTLLMPLFWIIDKFKK
jgi:hypothetical protein